MYIEFYGAAGQVTGSLHRVHLGGADILLDCGLFQGHRAEADRLNRHLPEWAPKASTLLLSHAHLDHSGNIPTLVKSGFEGNVFCTPPTRDLCSVMLRDSAMIQEQDAAYLHRRARRRGTARPIDPLYSVVDAQHAVEHMVSIPLRRALPIAPGAQVSFFNAGHVLGSALTRLDLAERGRRVRLLYTGDLGREVLPLLAKPDVVEGVDVLVIESTYGDRDHPSPEALAGQLADLVTETVRRGGRVYIPSFALERAQEVLYTLRHLAAENRIPKVPVFIDSPLAIAITEIYKLHPEALHPSIAEEIMSRDDPFAPPGLTYVSDIAASKALQAGREPCIIIAGSGMCEGGRIVHHFTRALGNPANRVIIVGYQAENTLGRRLVEGVSPVRVLGSDYVVRADVRQLRGLSAHAGRSDLVDFAVEVARRGAVRRVFVVHGEEGPRRALSQALSDRGLGRIELPLPGDRYEL